MRVHHIASARVVALAPGDTIDTAIALMEEHGFHHLPVVRNHVAIGMLSDRDVLLAVGWKLSSQRRLNGSPNGVAGPERVDQIMSHPVYTIGPNEEVSSAIGLMLMHQFGALPVVNDRGLCAMLTETDVVRALWDGRPVCERQPDLLAAPVHAYMRADVVTVGPQVGLTEVIRLFRAKHVRHLPVVAERSGAGDLLVGIVSDRDVRRAIGESAVLDEQAQACGAFYLGPTTAHEVMSAPVRTTDPDATLGEAVEQLLSHHIHALPVVKRGRLMGIVTETDVIRAIRCGASS